jgi:PAS domain S-box-containing protein
MEVNIRGQPLQRPLAARLAALSPLTRYGIAVAAAGLAVLLRMGLEPLWGDKLPLLPFYPATMASSWLGGFWPGMVTTLLCAAAAAYLWMPPVLSFTVAGLGDVIGLVLFVGIGALISGLNEAWRRASTTVTQSADQLRVTLGSIGDAVIATDDQGRVTMINAVACALTGWTDTEAIGQPLDDVLVLVSEESRRFVENPVHRVLREGVVAGLANHTLLISRGGREVPIDHSAAAIRGQDGRLVGAVIVFRDTTERRRAEARLRLIIESAPTAIVVANPVGQIILVNSQTETLFGYRREELTGQPVETLIPLRFRAHHPEYRRSFFDDPKSRPMGAGRELYGLRKDGSEFPVEIGLSPMETLEGVFVLSAIVDITERQRLERERATLLEQEQAARAEAERVTRMLQHVQAVTDTALSNEVSLDSLMRQLLTRVRAALAGDTATLWLLTDAGVDLRLASSDGPWEPLAEDVRVPLGHGVAGRIASSEAGMIFDDLKQVAVVNPFLRDQVKSLVGAPLRVSGRLIGVVHVDSSGPRQFTEDDLHLLRLVADRIGLAIERARLHEAERKALREAEAANRIKDEFLATVSHELRSPLNAIAGWARMLRTGQRDEAMVTRALDVIERNVKLQEGLIGDLLDLSRIVTGRLRLDVQPVDLIAVTGMAIDVVRPAADAKGIRLEAVLEPSARLVSGDPDRLQQVLWNLLSNAVKFTPRGGRVEIQLQRVNSQAELAVRDTGEGISPELLPHVFERFRQATGERVQAREGLGLGLAIVRHLVELHGGTVHADSPGAGQGATFIVRLPLLAVQRPAVRFEETRLALGRDRPHGAPSVLGGVRVLVVDDEADARELIRTVLDESGAVVTLAGSAAEALEAFERDRPEVLISDIAMPGEDGYALIRQVRALPPEQGGQVPGVAVTAHARTDDRIRALLAGFQLHVPKPVEAAELVAVVASLLGRTAAQDAPDAGTEG